MKIGNDYDFPYFNFLQLIDQGGVCYEGDKEDSFEAMFEKAEKHIREKEAPDRFDKKTRAALEEQYKNRDE